MTPPSDAPEKTELMGSLPEPWPDGLLPLIRESAAADRRKVVILDDDPTGTQTVHGLPILTTWAVDDLKAELSGPHPGFFILTNSRSLPREQAVRLNTEIARNLKEAAGPAQVKTEVISRSDSTLRGHFPDEIQALRSVLQMDDAPCLVIPFFLEGGRFTINDIHYVAEGGRLTPAAETPYAKDQTFGFSESDLRLWVEEKTGGQVKASRVASISINDLRKGGPDRIAEMLARLEPASYCVVNAASYRDMEVLVAGLLQAEAKGRRFIFRTAASFVRVRAGIEPRDLLTGAELDSAQVGGGLFIIGSHVPNTTSQMETLLASGGVVGIELSAERLLDDACSEKEIADACRSAGEALRTNRDVALFTSRELVKGRNAADSLDIARKVSDGLIRVVRGIETRPRYLVAKGGITSSDVAKMGLECKRAMIMGQILPGVPVWKLGPEARYPGMAYIVFPGNVGRADSLVKIKSLFE